MTANPNTLPLTPDTFRELHRFAGQITLGGREETVEDNRWHRSRVDFPSTLPDNTVVGRYASPVIAYDETTTLRTTVRLYGEAIGALGKGEIALGFINLDLKNATIRDSWVLGIIGISYELLSTQQVRAGIIYGGSSEDPNEQPAVEALLAELHINPAVIAERIGEKAVRGLLGLLRRASDGDFT